LPLRSILLLTPLLTLAAACGASHTSASNSPSSHPKTTSTVTAARVAVPLPASYAALGASETYGVGASPFAHGYAYLVAKALHARHFRDTGIPGTTLRDAYDTELAEALALRPGLATVFFGYNDITAHVHLGSFLSDLRDLALTLRSADTRVLIIGLPDLSAIPTAAIALAQLHVNLAAWNAGIRAVARQTGASFLNLSRFSRELASHPGYISSDGLHPSNRGHARLAQVIVAAIRQDRLWPYR
jgi:lysophospholipase L1-like esterase